MKIITKFDLGQEVVPISRGGYDSFVPCETCKGMGTITVKESNKELTCPSCYGRRGSSEYISSMWIVCVDSMSCIGKINVELYAEGMNRNDDSKTSYMLEATGVGSGTMWDEENLFSSIEDAKAECEIRNADLKCPLK